MGRFRWLPANPGVRAWTESMQTRTQMSAKRCSHSHFFTPRTSTQLEPQAGFPGLTLRSSPSPPTRVPRLRTLPPPLIYVHTARRRQTSCTAPALWRFGRPARAGTARNEKRRRQRAAALHNANRTQYRARTISRILMKRPPFCAAPGNQRIASRQKIVPTLIVPLPYFHPSTLRRSPELPTAAK